MKCQDLEIKTPRGLSSRRPEKDRSLWREICGADSDVPPNQQGPALIRFSHVALSTSNLPPPARVNAGTAGLTKTTPSRNPGTADPLRPGRATVPQRIAVTGTCRSRVSGFARLILCGSCKAAWEPDPKMEPADFPWKRRRERACHLRQLGFPRTPGVARERGGVRLLLSEFSFTLQSSRGVSKRRRRGRSSGSLMRPNP